MKKNYIYTDKLQKKNMISKKRKVRYDQWKVRYDL